MIRRHYFLLLAFQLAAFATGCSSTRPTPDERPNAGIVPPAVGLDTARHNPMPPVGPITKPGFIARIFAPRAIKQDEKKPSNPTGFINPNSVPRKCKGCQFTTVIGNDNKVTQASIDKNKATAQQASDAATMDATGDNSQLQAAHGDGNTMDAKKQDTTTKGDFWNSPAGYTVAAVLAGIGGYGLYLAWPVLVALLPKRRKTPMA